jgi:hypothetical protein
MRIPCSVGTHFPMRYPPNYILCPVKGPFLRCFRVFSRGGGVGEGVCYKHPSVKGLQGIRQGKKKPPRRTSGGASRGMGEGGGGYLLVIP